MDGEMGQVISLEIQGVRMAITAGLKTAEVFVRMIKALFDLRVQHKGEHSMKDIFKLSEGRPPEYLDLPQEFVEKLKVFAKSNKLHYSILADLDAKDGKIQFCVPPMESGAFQAFVRQHAKEAADECKTQIDKYDKQIGELNEKLLHCESDEEKEKLNNEIALLEQARDEASKSLDKYEKIAETGGVITMEDYLRTGRGGTFEEDPDKAISEINEGIEQGSKMSMKECLQPVRDESLMPESKIRFYLPDMGVEICREFHLDDDTKLVYSDYSLTTEKGEKVEMSDKNISAAKWNEEYVGKLLDAAGCVESTKARVFTSQEAMERFIKYAGQIKTIAEGNVEGFSNADVESEVKEVLSENLKGVTSAKMDKTGITFTIPDNALKQENGKLVYLDADKGDRYIFPEVVFKDHSVASRTMTFTIDPSEVVHIETSDNKHFSVSAKEASEAVSQAAEKLTESITKARTA